MGTEEPLTPPVKQRSRAKAWLRLIAFFLLGLLILFLGSFLLIGKAGPEAIFVLLLWCLPLFLH